MISQSKSSPFIVVVLILINIVGHRKHWKLNHTEIFERQKSHTAGFGPATVMPSQNKSNRVQNVYSYRLLRDGILYAQHIIRHNLCFFFRLFQTKKKGYIIYYTWTLIGYPSPFVAWPCHFFFFFLIWGISFFPFFFKGSSPTKSSLHVDHIEWRWTQFLHMLHLRTKSDTTKFCHQCWRRPWDGSVGGMLTRRGSP